jgi:hypothetical protein
MILPLEQETYKKVNLYRQQFRTSALTSLDTLTFASIKMKCFIREMFAESTK